MSLSAKKEEIAIIGAGAQAKYIIDIFSFSPSQDIIGVVDLEKNPEIQGTKINGIKVIGEFSSVMSKLDKNTKVIIAYSDNKKKEKIVQDLRQRGFQFINAIHPQAVIAKSAKIGEGCIINAQAVVMPLAKIGDHVVIHSNVVVEHDNVLEDYVNLAPGVTLAGYVRVKKGAYIYTGSSVIPKVTIGKHSVVGAGAVVLEDVPPYTVVAGVPARIIKRIRR